MRPSLPTGGALLHLVNARLSLRRVVHWGPELGLLKTYTSKKVFLTFLPEHLPVKFSQGEQGEALSPRGGTLSCQEGRAPLNTCEDFGKGPSES